MRPRSAPAAAAATAAAHRSAGKRQDCQGPVVRACKGVGDRPFSLCEERIGAVSHGKRRSKNPPRQALPGLVRQVAPQRPGEEKEESGPGRETLKRGRTELGRQCPRPALSRGGAKTET